MSKKQAGTDAAMHALREFGLRYPGAHLKSPWPGHLDLAVKDKTFAYLSVAGEPFKISCKLPDSNAVALLLPFCSPTEYGLGKSGWVTAKPPEGKLPLDMFKAWIDESYRAQAPKKLVAALAAAPAGESLKAAAPSPKRAKKAAPKPATRPAKSRSAKPAKPKAKRKAR